MKIRPMGAELFHADGRTDTQTDRNDETNSRFSQFWKKHLKGSRFTSSFLLGFWHSRPYSNLLPSFDD